MDFLKSFITRGYSKKLDDDPILSSEDDEYEFQVKYLGDSPISESNSAKSTAQAVRNIVQIAKRNKGKEDSAKVTLSISPNGIRTHIGSSCCVLDVPLSHVSFCSADAKMTNVFAFVCANSPGNFKCYAFECDGKKKAREIAITLNRVFSLVYNDMKRDKTPSQHPANPS